ncbi:MAG: NAD(P)-binding protein [Candidatus Azotimanducaceae bacterium]
MAERLTEIQDMTTVDTHLDYHAVVIGAGVAGIYQIKRLADLGVRATVLDANPDLGGTWYNNRYPGARFDSESYTYSYSFSKSCSTSGIGLKSFHPSPRHCST